MRKVLFVAAGVVFVLGASWFYLFDPRGPWTNRWCSRGVLDEAESPGGVLTARAVDFMCGIVAPGYWATVVIVTPGRAPSQEDEVLTGDILRDEIKLTWKSPDRLEIAVSSVSHISHYKTEHAGVNIDLVRRQQP